MSGGRKREPQRQAAAVAAVLVSPTLEEAAKVAGIGVATLRRWRKEPGFRADLARARREALDLAVSQLAGAAGEAVATLRSCLGPKNPPATRARAAVAILDHATKGVELLDVAARLEALEERELENGADAPRSVRERLTEALESMERLVGGGPPAVRGPRNQAGIG